MPFLYRNQRKIYYLIETAIHREQAKTIVLIHTNVTDHTLYNRIVPHLREQFNVIRYDLAGYGLSELGEEDISLELYVEDFTYLVRSLQLPSFYIMAIGYGGFIAMEYNKLHQDKVLKMVLMTMPCFPTETLDSVREHRRKISFEGTSIPVDNILKKTTLLAEDDPEYMRLHNIMTKLPVPTYMKMMDLTTSADTISIFEKNMTPTLVLAGEREIIFPQHLIALTCAYLPGYQYAVIPNASSFLMIDQPKITAKLATEFFNATIEQDRYNDEGSTTIYDEVRQYTRHLYQEIIKPEPRNQIHIDLLYTFNIFINGHHVMKGLNRRYAKHILIYLLFNPTTTRENICEILWPQDALQISKKNLRVYLSHLKQLLNPYSIAHPILITDRNQIHINGEITSDVITLLADLQRIEQMEDTEQKFNYASAIISTFDSANYMTAIYDPWFLNIRQKVEQKLIQLIIWMGIWLVKHGEGRQALQLTEQCLQIFEESIKLYDTLIHLCQEIHDEQRMQFWVARKAAVWD